MMRQDDPRKCTAARAVRSGAARPARRPRPGGILLDPFSPRLLLAPEGRAAMSVTAVDCSWRGAESVFGSLPGLPRSLPPLLAGNPLNYSRVGALTTAEALAGALWIMGRPDQARAALSGLRWGHTFLELNGGLLADYAGLRSEEGLPGLLASYGLPPPGPPRPRSAPGAARRARA